MSKIFYIVGKRIKDQFVTSGLDSLICYENFIKLYKENYIIRPVEFRLGQGLSQQQIANIQLIAHSNKKSKYSFSYKCLHTFPTCKTITHKRRAKNVMVSIPRMLSNYQYKSELLVDERCYEMKDHLTGWHIQGAVLIEAARQMVIAVSEKFLLSSCKKNSYKFLLSNLTANFKAYTYPFEVDIVCNILDIKARLPHNSSMKMKLTFIQNNFETFNIELEQHIIDKDILSIYELSNIREHLVV